MKKFFRPWQAAALLALAVPVAITNAADPPLALEQAQRLAVDHSQQLKGNAASVQSSREMAVAAAQNPDPVLRLGIENVPTDGQDRFSTSRDFMTMRRVGVTQEFTRSEKRQLRGERYTREADKALAEQSATLTDVQRDTALAWLER